MSHEPCLFCPPVSLSQTAASIANTGSMKARSPKPRPLPLPTPQEHPQFDTVCLATAMHKLANLRGAPNLHAQIVQAPEFFKLKQLIREPLRALGFCFFAI